MIGKLITSIIEDNEEIQSIINGMLFPVSDWFGREDDSLPVIYYIVKMVPDSVKNGGTMATWKVTLLTMSEDYGASWDLSMKLAEAFEGKMRQTVNGFRLSYVNVESITDDYEFNLDSYGQTVEITIKTQRIIN